MERPIETRTLGEAVVTSFQLKKLSCGWVQVTFCTDEDDGDVYERARIVMPPETFEALRSAAAPILRPRKTPEAHLQ